MLFVHGMDIMIILCLDLCSSNISTFFCRDHRFSPVRYISSQKQNLVSFTES